VGFAIPSNDLEFVMDRLMVDGKVMAGMLPIRTQQVTWMIQQAIGTPGLQGALLAALEPGGDRMMDRQIKPGDVILSFNGQTVLDPRDLARKAARTPIGSDAALTIWRGRVQQMIHVKIQAWPEAKPHLISELAPRAVGLQLASAPQGGVMISSVDPSGSAADSGIEKGDVIERQRPGRPADHTAVTLSTDGPYLDEGRAGVGLIGSPVRARSRIYSGVAFRAKEDPAESRRGAWA
jgi:serine protease Do